MIRLYDFQRQSQRLARHYQRAFDRVMMSGCYEDGQEVESFEKAYAEANGAAFGVGVGNGMEALQIALMALKIPLCGEVITSPLASVATVQAILSAGHVPVFADVDEDSGLLDPTEAAKQITPLTVALLPVHLFGRPAALEDWEALAQEHQLTLVQDAAQAHGAQRLGKPFASYGGSASVVATSFHPAQNLGALGDAGMVLTNNAEIAQAARELRNLGFKNGDAGAGQHLLRGLSSRMDELQAAILAEKLLYLPEENATRLQIARHYRAEIHHSQVRIPEFTDRDDSVYHIFPVRVPDRASFQAHLEKAGIESGLHYPTLVPKLPAYSNLASSSGRWPHAERWAAEEVSIPIHQDMRQDEVEFVVETINQWKN